MHEIYIVITHNISAVEPVCGTVVSLVLASVSQLGYTKADLRRCTWASCSFGVVPTTVPRYRRNGAASNNQRYRRSRADINDKKTGSPQTRTCLFYRADARYHA